MRKVLTEAISIHTKQTVLSSTISVYKTERFAVETGRARGADAFLTKLVEAIILNVKLLNSVKNRTDGCEVFGLETVDGAHSFLFKFGGDIKYAKLLNDDIVFFKYYGAQGRLKKNDFAFENYLLEHSAVRVVLTLRDDSVASADFLKLYRLTASSKVNFPLLSEGQKKIVYTEDKNVLVQGVAGSGKTNVCIDKIVFTACRNYAGKILYATFSRGLLLETRGRLNEFKRNLMDFAEEYAAGNVVFCDADEKTAIERRLGIYFAADSAQSIVDELLRIVEFLDSQVDYLLLEDLYTSRIGEVKVVGEEYFVKHYVKNVKNHQLASKLQRVQHLSYEVVYKEIYGLIYGAYDTSKPADKLSLDEYIALRENSFSKSECEIIYSLGVDYATHLARSGLVDNNTIARALLATNPQVEYSLAILDEVQDMTEVNLCLFKKLAYKLFCVGDALQMINPSFFSFAYLKRLLFEKDVVSVAELKNNYRSTRTIASVIDELGEINVSQFGTHSFVLHGDGVDSVTPSFLGYTADEKFLQGVVDGKYDGVTVIVSSAAEKEALRKVMKTTEILTVSEIKGLERDTVILYNLLSDNRDKWDRLERVLINRKQADENSVYRYYFNLFYVGLSRAKTNVFVSEKSAPNVFGGFFKRNFTSLSARDGVEALSRIATKLELDEEEIDTRIAEFIRAEQYDNARFTASKLADELEKRNAMRIIDVNEQYVRRGDYRGAGVAYWKYNLYDKAKEQFELSGDHSLIRMMDACVGRDAKGLDIDILRYYDDIKDNEVAGQLLVEVVGEDLNELKDRQRQLATKLRAMNKRK